MRALGIVAVVLLAVPSCSSADDEPTSWTVDERPASGDTPDTWPLFPLEDALVGVRSDGLHSPSPVVSDDGGRRWERADLPGAPARLALTPPADDRLVAADGVAVLTGIDPTSAHDRLPVAQSEVHVWASTDGHTWRGRQLTTDGPVRGQPQVAAAGDVLLLAASTTTGAFHLFTSDDAGTTWRRAALRGLHLPGSYVVLERARAIDGGVQVVVVHTDGIDEAFATLTSSDGGRTWMAERCPTGCGRVSADGLLADYSRTSSDGGATWQQVVLEPDPFDGSEPEVRELQAVEGGWLARMRTDDDDLAGSILARSDDGRTWRPVLARPGCTDRDLGEPVFADVTFPTSFHGRWFAASVCHTGEDRARSDVHVSGPSATSFRRIEGATGGHRELSRPVVHRGTLLVPWWEDGLGGTTVIGAG